MKINYRISLAIIITSTLHIVGLAAYIFDIIPDAVQKLYYYNLERIYIITMMILFSLLSVDKLLRLTLIVSTVIQLCITIIINIKYFVTLTNEANETIWIITLSLSMLICLITLIYVSRK